MHPRAAFVELPFKHPLQPYKADGAQQNQGQKSQPGWAVAAGEIVDQVGDKWPGGGAGDHGDVD